MVDKLLVAESETAEAVKRARIISVVIPCYKVSNSILKVISEIGQEVSQIYVVDDACPENTGMFVQDNNTDPRVTVLFNDVNLGVGGAMITGYKAALDNGADIVVKVDGDGQMNPQFIPLLVRPIVDGRADYAKGNRFFTLESLNPMPKARIFGNAVLSFMAKLSTGYWQIFDPTNGYTAIHAKVLAELPLDKLSKRFFFETDMLFRLYTIQAVAVDVPMKAIYADEPSNLRIGKVIPEFLWNHLVNLVKRLFYCYILRNFSAFSIQLMVGMIMLVFGTIYGSIEWYRFASRNVPAPTGIIMIATLPSLIGIQFILSFLNWDASNIPSEPLHRRL
jgi:dolichol-phosphate mannosyltransferase